jgi:hypothetical protein
MNAGALPSRERNQAIGAAVGRAEPCGRSEIKLRRVSFPAVLQIIRNYNKELENHR